MNRDQYQGYLKPILDEIIACADRGMHPALIAAEVEAAWYAKADKADPWLRRGFPYNADTHIRYALRRIGHASADDGEQYRRSAAAFQRDQNILRLRQAGKSYRQIGEELRLSPGYVYSRWRTIENRETKQKLWQSLESGYGMWCARYGTRIGNALHNAGLRDLEQLAKLSDEDLLAIDGLGIVGIAEIRKTIPNPRPPGPIPEIVVKVMQAAKISRKQAEAAIQAVIDDLEETARVAGGHTRLPSQNAIPQGGEPLGKIEGQQGCELPGSTIAPCAPGGREAPSDGVSGRLAPDGAGR